MNKNIKYTALLLLTSFMASAQGLTQFSKDDIITEAPDGLVKYYNVTSGYFTPQGGPINDTANRSAEIVFCDNGDVYIKNPVVHFNTNSYIKGRQEQNKLVFDLPQLIRLPQANYPGFCARFKCEYNEDGTRPYYYYDENNQTVTYDVLGDGTIKLEDSFDPMHPNIPKFVIGFTGGMTAWAGYGDFNVTYTPVEGQPITAPVGVEVEKTWVIKSSNSVPKFVSVAIDGDDFYLGNLYETVPYSFIKGKIAGGKVVFENGQLLGRDGTINYFLYVVGGHTEQEFNEQLGVNVTRMRLDENLTFDYDAENRVLSTTQSLVINTETDRISLVKDYDACQIFYQDPNVEYGKPQIPEITEAYPYNGEFGYVTFRQPELDENGALMDVNNLYYNLYVNGHKFTFYQDEYPTIPEDGMLNMPYLFNDRNSQIYGGTTIHSLYYYFYGADTLGVRSVHVLADGTEIASDIATYNFGENGGGQGGSGIEELGAPVATQMFDLQGRKVENPTGGIYVKVDTYSDGTVRTSKVAIK